MLTFFKYAVVLSLIALGCCPAFGDAAEKTNVKYSPNVLLIVVDDLGFGELGCYGGTEIATPHIDALAASGIAFTNGYVTASYCATSRAGLLTGRYQTRFGFEFNPVGAVNCEPGIGLPRQRTIADFMRGHGYATALVGKWLLGGTPDFHPQRRGFDEFFGFLHEGKTWELHDLASDLGETNDLSEKHPEVLQRLVASWDVWNEQQSEPLWK